MQKIEHTSKNSSLVGMKIHFEYIADSFMKRIKPYCTSGQFFVMFFQLTGTATDTGKLPLYSLGMLITNGIDRHSITCHAGWNTEQIQGFNNSDTYNESKWMWFRYNTTNLE